MSWHSWNVKSLKHLCALMSAKNSPRSGLTKLVRSWLLPVQAMGSFQWWFGIQLYTRYPPYFQPCLSHLGSYSGKSDFCFQKWLSCSWPPLVWRHQTKGFWGSWFEGTDRQCLGLKFGNQTEDYWLSSQFLFCLCSSPLLQAANHLHPTWILVEEHKRAKSANTLNMTVRHLSVLNSLTFCCCSLQIISVSCLGESVYRKSPLQQI